MTPEELDALRAEAQGVLVTAPASEWLADRLLVVIDALREARAALDRVRALCGQMNFIDATLVLAVIEGES